MLKVKRALKNSLHLVNAILASIYFGFPGRKLKVIGITGTDGKTTTTYMIYNILKTAGRKVGLINTIEAVIDSETKPTGLHVTTPSPWVLSRILREMVNKNFEYAVLEVTSHGIAQSRVWGIPFLVGVITNVTNEHLDYHESFENYLKTKMKLLQKASYSVVNSEAESYTEMNQIISNKENKHSYGFDSKNDTNLKDLESIQLKLPGTYNMENALAAISVAKILHIDPTSIKAGLEKTSSPKGRFNIIRESPFRVIVDFAHTPNALEQVLKEVIKTTKENLIVVFGCAGERDRRKRPEMGRIASEHANAIILTAEDPRSESVAEINAQILSGVLEERKKKITCIEDREEAIKKALSIAVDEDTIIITGKGHEESMCFGKKEYSWSDLEIVEKLLSTLESK